MNEKFFTDAKKIAKSQKRLARQLGVPGRGPINVQELTHQPNSGSVRKPSRRSKKGPVAARDTHLGESLRTGPRERFSYHYSRDLHAYMRAMRDPWNTSPAAPPRTNNIRQTGRATGFKRISMVDFDLTAANTVQEVAVIFGSQDHRYEEAALGMCSAFPDGALAPTAAFCLGPLNFNAFGGKPAITGVPYFWYQATAGQGTALIVGEIASNQARNQASWAGISPYSANNVTVPDLQQVRWVKTAHAIRVRWTSSISSRSGRIRLLVPNIQSMPSSDEANSPTYTFDSLVDTGVLYDYGTDDFEHPLPIMDFENSYSSTYTPEAVGSLRGHISYPSAIMSVLKGATDMEFAVDYVAHYQLGGKLFATTSQPVLENAAAANVHNAATLVMAGHAGSAPAIASSVAHALENGTEAAGVIQGLAAKAGIAASTASKVGHLFGI